MTRSPDPERESAGGGTPEGGAPGSGPPEAGDPPGVRPDELGTEIWAVLGGGALKGLTHVGAWKAFDEGNLSVHGIVGTSIGALVGVCLAGGMGWDELVPLALELEREDIVRVNRRAVWINGVKTPSVYQGEVLRDYVDSVLPVQSWDELGFPVQLNAVDLGTGGTEWFGPGARTDVPVLDAVCASASLPVLYPPVRVGGSYYVDGGAGDALPLGRAAELGATGIVAVDAGADPEGPTGGNPDRVVEQGMVAIHQRVFSIMSGRRRRAVVREWEGPPLLYVRPRLAGYSGFDFGSVKYFLEEGYRATRRALHDRDADS